MAQTNDPTEKCYLAYDDTPGYLVCFYNHKAGEECLMNRENNHLTP